MAGVFRGADDKLDDQVRRFPQARLNLPVFINSVPKSGTHLLLNILRMFTPPEQYYRYNFVQIGTLGDHPQVFASENCYLSAGHILFADVSARALRGVRHVLLIRDPYDVVLARARHYTSEQYQSASLAHLKSGEVSTADLLSLMILGIHQKALPLRDLYMHNAVAWRARDVVHVKYEDVVAAAGDLNSGESESFFRRLLADCGIDLIPDDWRERVRIGAEPAYSRTARCNVKISPAVDIPDALPEQHKQLLDYVAPGLRALLGYA